LEETVVALAYNIENTAVGILCVDVQHPLFAKAGTNFNDKQWLLDQYSLFADSV
jgi:hypothetical protein